MQEYEEIKESDRINSAGRACYVERNREMIDNSDFAIFYLSKKRQDENIKTAQNAQHPWESFKKIR